MKRVISWNVNGIRAADRKGLFEWLRGAGPDFLCVQETKAQPEQLDEHFLSYDGYTAYFRSAERKGYSGVAVYTREKPEDVSGFGVSEFDAEGRVIALHYPSYSVISAYFPNSGAETARLPYKLDFCAAMLEYCEKLAAQGRQFILCGDFNIAHRPIDLARPKQNEQSAGYLPQEREWMESFLSSGFADTFRRFNTEPGNYTWWSYLFKAREKNIGWRIDYHCVPEYLMPKVRRSAILADVMGSDHCPILIEIDV